MKFENTIALGTVVHLLLLVGFLSIVVRLLFRRLDRIEDNTNEILGTKPHERK